MKRRGGDDYVVATAKKGNPYAARVVLKKKRIALRRGKSVNTVFVPNARSHRTRRRNPQILPPDCLALLQNRGNFERSAAPERLMFFQNGTWRNFPADPTESFKEAFNSKIPTVVVENQGGKYLIDFIRMLQVDLVSGFERSIAWIDINGKCFFPKMFIGGDDSLDSSPLKLKIEINIDKAEPKAGGESEAQSENRAFEDGGGENGTCQRGLKEGSCGDEMRTCGTREGTGESEAGEGGIRDSNSGNGVGEIATKEGKGENGVYGVDMRERSEGSGSLANQLNYVEPKEIVAYIPDLNQNGVDFNQNESAEMGNALKVDEVSLSHPPKSNSTRDEEVRVLSGSKENEVINSNFVNSREEYEAIKGLASLKRTLDSSFDIVEKTCQVKIPDSSKRARLSRSPEPKNMLEKPAFDSMGIVLAKLSETNKAYTAVKNLFLGGMTKLDEMAKVNEIYWCSHASPMGSARLEAFQKNMEMTKSSRGEANVKYAWYGASPNMVESAVVHGFGQVGSRSGGSSYGIGVHLTPEGHSYESACHSEPDMDNVFHVVLCRVIMGNMEQIEHGSHQFHPSNDNFDSGVDNLEEPRWYIVWSTHMNTNILPEFVVSFTVSQKLRELWRRNLMQNSVTVPQSLSSPRETRTPNVGSPFDAVPGVGNHHHPSMDARGQNQGRAPSPGFPPNMSFPSLFSALRGHLSQNTMESLDKVYNDYKVGEFPKDVLVRRVRSIAGDKVLMSALRSLRN